MSNRDKLLASIADIIKDYRDGEIKKPTPEHVNRWVQQFSEDIQIPLLTEVEHVFQYTYFSKKDVEEYFADLNNNEQIAGKNPGLFWEKANLLNIQQHGHSQSEILTLFGKCLKTQCGISLEDCGSQDGAFIYFDDVLFSGTRIGSDLKAWIQQQAPDNSIVKIIVIGAYKLGEWQCIEGLKKASTNAGKSITFEIWAAFRFENRKRYKNVSEVLWPAYLPDDADLADYVAQENKYPFEPRLPGGTLRHKIFSGENGRQILERELLLAGTHIRSGCQSPKPTMRPLGFGYFGLGFGATIVTYRNCPNNCPLALWWGDSEVTSGPFHWYPLLPRKTYEQPFDLYDQCDWTELWTS